MIARYERRKLQLKRSNGASSNETIAASADAEAIS